MLRDPILIEEETGLYVTQGQLQFFLNRPNGEIKFEHETIEYQDWDMMCKVYNLVYDMSEEDPKAGCIYWDSVNQCVAFYFPKDGKIHNKLKEYKVDLEFEDDDEYDSSN
jgi:hypothetical protein